MASYWYVAHLSIPETLPEQISQVQKWQGWLGDTLALPIPPLFIHLQIVAPKLAQPSAIEKALKLLQGRIDEDLGRTIPLSWRGWQPDTLFTELVQAMPLVGREMTCTCEGQDPLRLRHLKDAQAYLPALRAMGETVPENLLWVPTVVLNSQGKTVPVYWHTVPTREG